MTNCLKYIFLIIMTVCTVPMFSQSESAADLSESSPKKTHTHVRSNNKRNIYTTTSVESSDFSIIPNDREGLENSGNGSKNMNFRGALDWCKKYHLFDNLNVSATLGTTGVGLEVSAPVTKWASLRTGFTWLPSLKMPLRFDINTFSDGKPSNNFYHVRDLVYNLTGIKISNTVKMKGIPHLLEYKLLVDVYPFQQNRHWHFTAGFFLGSDCFARAYNNKDAMPSLVGLNIYNRAYEYFTHVTDIYDVPLGGGNYLDPDLVVKLRDKFTQYGRMGVHVGDYKDGTPYIMEPASDGSVSADAYVHRFKPYLGFGYAGNLDKTGKWTIGFEAGAMFWGGVPDLINQEGVNMTKDLVDVPGKVGRYISFMKCLPVYPVVELKISYSFF